MSTNQAYIIRVICHDQPGIVARITSMLLAQGANILDLEQHVEEDSGLFAMRLHVEKLSSMTSFQNELNKDCAYPQFEMWVDSVDPLQRVALLVTKEETCLYDILIKQKMGDDRRDQRAAPNSNQAEYNGQDADGNKGCRCLVERVQVDK